MSESGNDNNPKGWTFATLEAFLEAQIKALKDATAIAMTASEKAIDKAEKSDDKRFTLLNEFRATTNDQQANFANKEQTEFRLGALDRQMASIEKALAQNSGKGQGVWLVAVIISQGLLILIGAAALLRH